MLEEVEDGHLLQAMVEAGSKAVMAPSILQMLQIGYFGMGQRTALLILKYNALNKLLNQQYHIYKQCLINVEVKNKSFSEVLVVSE